MRPPLRLGLALGLALPPASALAEPASGTLLASSRSVSAPAISEDLPARRSIRGATVEGRESPELRAMREFEADRFGPARRRDLPDEATPSEADVFAGLRRPDIPVRFEPRLLRYLELYKNERRGRSIMSAWLKRQGRYRDLIESALERHHLPRALVDIAMIESGYDPRDRSSAGASGLWQFMPEGGRIYGLRIDYWVDERNDPEKSTEAVMRYFDDLHARFGSWHLALAAFNAGYGAVLNSVAKYNTNDYWALSRQENGLPWETVNYVPKFLATAVVDANREAFGYGDVQPDPPITFDRVRVPASTTLANVARAAGVTLEQLAALNPELRRDRTPPEEWNVRVPRGAGPRFLQAFEPSRERVRPYVVKQGDRLETIAKAARTSTAEIKRINTIRDQAELRPGTTLVVPDRDRKPEASTDGKDDDATLVPLPDRDQAVEGRRRVFYRVAPGDGPGEIARFFRVTEDDLARWNNLDLSARLLGSQVLQVWVEPAFDPGSAGLDPAHLKLVTVGSDEFFDAVETRRGRRRLTVTAHAGDTLKKIGARYGLTEADMERINRMPRTTELAEGQPLVVYVPLGKAGGPDAGTTPLPGAPLPPVEDPYAGATARRSLFKPVSRTKLALDDAPSAPAPTAPPADDPLFPDLGRPAEAPPPTAIPAPAAEAPRSDESEAGAALIIGR